MSDGLTWLTQNPADRALERAIWDRMANPVGISAKNAKKVYEDVGIRLREAREEVLRLTAIQVSCATARRALALAELQEPGGD